MLDAKLTDLQHANVQVGSSRAEAGDGWARASGSAMGPLDRTELAYRSMNERPCVAYTSEITRWAAAIRENCSALP